MSVPPAAELEAAAEAARGVEVDSEEEEEEDSEEEEEEDSVAGLTGEVGLAEVVQAEWEAATVEAVELGEAPVDSAAEQVDLAAGIAAAASLAAAADWAEVDWAEVDWAERAAALERAAPAVNSAAEAQVDLAPAALALVNLEVAQTAAAARLVVDHRAASTIPAAAT
jgi:hypothetical protein